jgi:hypothetical protein
MRKNKLVFIASLFLLAVMYFLSKFDQGTAVYEFRSSYGGSLIDPLEFLSISLVATTFILLFFSDKIFNLWLKKFMIWFAPLAAFIILIGASEVNYGWPTRTSFAILVGEVLVGSTLLFALIQRFYYKVK